MSVFDAVAEAVLEFVLSGLPERRWARVLVTMVCIVGIAATAATIYLAFSGSL
jgi:hypothetical protein